MRKSEVNRYGALLTFGGEFFILITWWPFFTIYIHHHIGRWDKALRIAPPYIITFE